MKRVASLPTLILLLVAFAAGGATAHAQSSGSAEISQQDRQDIERAETYLNRIQTMRADFTQIDANRQVSHGKIYLSRPGRMRVQFDPPRKMIMVATSVWLIIDDGESNEPTYIPLRTSPAGILVKENIRLTGGDLQVLDVRRTEEELFVQVADAGDVEKGSVVLIFRKEPMRLNGWTVIDAQGNPTRVSFTDMETGIELDRSLFQYISRGRDEDFGRLGR